jgi:hypothetical protein
METATFGLATNLLLSIRVLAFGILAVSPSHVRQRGSDVNSTSLVSNDKLFLKFDLFFCQYLTLDLYVFMTAAGRNQSNRFIQGVSDQWYQNDTGGRGGQKEYFL